MPPRALPPALLMTALPAAHDSLGFLGSLQVAIMTVQTLTLLHITIDEGPCTLPKASPTFSDLIDRRA